MFFDLCRAGRLDGATATLSDSNRDLIGCYQALRDEFDDVVRSLTRLERAHRQKGAAHYYDIRDNHFNPARLARVPHAPAPARYPPELAAMLIYLNRTGYNGLFRVNARGEFNVPVGRYENPRICDRDNLARVSAILRQPGVRLKVRTFDALTPHSGPVDFYYLDPPYAPLTSDVAVHSLYGWRIHGRRSAAPAGAGDRPRLARRADCPQQLDRARGARALHV